MIKSAFLRLNQRDFQKALAMAFYTSFIASIMMWVNMGSVPTIDNLKAAAVAGGISALGYLLKNLLENEKGELGI